MIDAFEALDSLPISSTTDFDIEAWLEKCHQVMNDDFNTPLLIAQLFEAVKFIFMVKNGQANINEATLEKLKQQLLRFTQEVLGLRLQLSSADGNTDALEKTVALLIELRDKARNNKDFATSDRIRDGLTDAGIQLFDGKEGTTFKLN